MIDIAGPVKPGDLPYTGPMPTKAEKIEECLRSGKSVSETKEIVRCREDWVREVARKRGLPTNRPIFEGSVLETQILTSLVIHGFTDSLSHSTSTTSRSPEMLRQQAVRDVAFLFRQTPDRIWDIIHRKALKG